MKLFCDDALVSPQAEPGAVDAAVSSFGSRRSAAVELRDDAGRRLRAVRAGSEGFFLEIWQAGMISGVFLPETDLEQVSRTFREYLEGRPPEIVTKDAFDPDCPLCAMLAAQARPEARA